MRPRPPRGSGGSGSTPSPDTWPADAVARGGTAAARSDRSGYRPVARRAARLATPPTVIDVRTPAEAQQRRIEAAVNIPLSRLQDHLDTLANRPIVVHCASGYSAVAANVLRREGLPRVADLVGGLAAWESAGLPTASQRQQSGDEHGAPSTLIERRETTLANAPDYCDGMEGLASPHAEVSAARRNAVSPRNVPGG